MKPTIVLVGRPNVGKSTFFNAVTKTRDALVASEPGLTRDRRYGITAVDDNSYIIVDTGGLTGENDEMNRLITGQVDLAVRESDMIFFLVDGRELVNSQDEQIGRSLRSTGKPIWLIVNKAESVNRDDARAEFSVFGFENIAFVSAVHRTGIKDLFVKVGESFPGAAGSLDEAPDLAIKVAIVGRPNVGKSTLLNRLVGENRVIAADFPGTTRDSIFVPFTHDDDQFILIDTAGIRRRSRITDVIEKFSVIKALQGIETSNVVIYVIDAKQGVGKQDADLIGFTIERGKGLIIVVNKWDGLIQEQKDSIKRELDLNLSFVKFAKIITISALHGTGVGSLLDEVKTVYEASNRQFSTTHLTNLLEQLIQKHQPPLVNGRRIKLRYAHQGGRNPPVIVIHGNQTQFIPDSYKKYLMNAFSDALSLSGTPMRIEFKSGENPFRNKKNSLTKRQITKRRRLLKFTKSKK